MAFIRLGGEKVEGFYFHNNWKVQVDYGLELKIFIQHGILKSLQLHQMLLRVAYLLQFL